MSARELAEIPAGMQPSARAGVGPRRSAWRSPAGRTVILLTAVGLGARLVVAHESLFGDELSTYWIVARHGLHGVLSLIYGTASIKHVEITPPLYFVASWFTLHLGDAPIPLRLPSLVAGTLIMPGVYLLGLRTVGQRRALVAAALTAASPFMVYYSTEARAYGVMMALVVGSTLSLLLAVDTGRTRWWVSFAVCAGLAFWTHYTCTFVLGAQLLWVLWAHPEQRRRALLASVGAAVLVLPWVPGLINEAGSPTVNILSDLSPFTPGAVRVILGHWSLGYPYTAIATLTQVPGRPALVLIVLAAAAVLVGLIWRHRDWPHAAGRLQRENRVVLVALLLVATPVCEALVSLVSTHLFGVRNLAASWPELALGFSVVALAAGRRVGLVACALVVIGLALGTLRMVDGNYGRPDFGAAGAYVDAHFRRGDVVIDETGRYLTPGPLTGLDVTLRRPVLTVRALAPEEREHPFTLSDPFVSVAAATKQAVADAAPRARIFLVGGNPHAATLAANAGVKTAASAYRRVVDGLYGDVSVEVYARSSSSGG